MKQMKNYAFIFKDLNIFGHKIKILNSFNNI